jgi:hypothetical protein
LERRKATVSHTLALARSSRVHRQIAGRDYAAPLQWKLLSLSSEWLDRSEVSEVE